MASVKPRPSWLKVRLCLAALVMTGLLGMIGAKAWTLQIGQGQRMRALGEAQYLHELELTSPRGSILDRNGVELAATIAVDSVYADPALVTDRLGTAQLLAQTLKLPAGDVREKLGAAGRFVWLKRRVSAEEAQGVRELALPGIGLRPEWRRYYPARELAGPVLGHVGVDGRGLDGLELALDETLRGRGQRLKALRDARGGLLLGVAEQHAATSPGATITLTLDRFIQYASEAALVEGVQKNKARAGIAVVLDARTSEVLAMALVPTLDPNDAGGSDARNRAVTDAYEAGSVMKVFSVAAALDAGGVQAHDLVDVEGGRLQIGRKTIRDTHFERSPLSVAEIVKFSSNVGAAKIARRLGKEGLVEGLRRFGFGSRTGIELPGERSGRIRDADRWREIDLATGSFGYGLTVTPLQIAAALVPVANGGMWYPPTILTTTDRREGRRVIKPETADAVSAMLRMVMEEGGTGASIKASGFSVAGKTGTAHKVDPETRKYAADRYLSSFVGFAPVEDPRLVILVMIDEPRGAHHYGGHVAGPVFARIAEEGLRYLGVPGAGPDVQAPAWSPEPGARSLEPGAWSLEPVADILEDLPPAGPNEPIVIIPDFTGMTLAQAVFAAAEAGVKLDLEGSGRAVKQFPGPGRALRQVRCLVTFDPG